VLAIAGAAHCIVTGDKLLLGVDGYNEIEIIRPREFVDRYLTQS
jgi:predicted nucleic acid-binding protein